MFPLAFYLSRFSFPNSVSGFFTGTRDVHLHHICFICITLHCFLFQSTCPLEIYQQVVTSGCCPQYIQQEKFVRIIVFFVILVTFCYQEYLELTEKKMCCTDFKLNLPFCLKESQNASFIFASEKMETQFSFRRKAVNVTVILKIFSLKSTFLSTKVLASCQ